MSPAVSLSKLVVSSVRNDPHVTFEFLQLFNDVTKITADHRNVYFLIFTLYCQMPLNIQINLLKRCHKTRKNRYFEEEVYGTAGMEVDCN